VRDVNDGVTPTDPTNSLDGVHRGTPLPSRLTPPIRWGVPPVRSTFTGGSSPEVPRYSAQPGVRESSRGSSGRQVGGPRWGQVRTPHPPRLAGEGGGHG